jgi:hypothetical protein
MLVRGLFGALAVAAAALAGSVSYDPRAIVVDGKRELLVGRRRPRRPLGFTGFTRAKLALTLAPAPPDCRRHPLHQGRSRAMAADHCKRQGWLELHIELKTRFPTAFRRPAEIGRAFSLIVPHHLFSQAGGMNVIQTYVFWNEHEPEFRAYDFETGGCRLV